MTKYLTSRLLILFLIKFFYNWAINTKPQLIQFFDLNDGFFLDLLSNVLLIVILGLGIVVINALFSILHLSQGIALNEIIEKNGNNGFLYNLATSIVKFCFDLIEKFEGEAKLEKYPYIFIVFALLFLYSSKGNPILNNYYGIYKEYEGDDQGRLSERTNYIIHKSKINELNNRIRSLEEDVDEDEPYFEVHKRGYLFIQTGLIDGYKTNFNEYNGFSSYIECLLFSAIEKLINTIMYFLIPFILCIIIYQYKFENTNK